MTIEEKLEWVKEQGGFTSVNWNQNLLALCDEVVAMKDGVAHGFRHENIAPVTKEEILRMLTERPIEPTRVWAKRTYERIDD